MGVRNYRDHAGTDNELQVKLEKALDELSTWKDKFLKEKETPIKASISNGGLYSPGNRLKSAPYPVKNNFRNTFYSQNAGNYHKTIYADYTRSPVVEKEKSEFYFLNFVESQGNDINFTIDVNGVPHSVYNSANETTGRILNLT